MGIQAKTAPGFTLTMATLRTAVARPASYAMVIVISLLAAFAYKLHTESIFACSATGYGSDNYLAYCQTTGYGDYDHGAFWFGLEPQARQAAANADVLFVGNSRMQFAFSTQATTDWFKTSSALYYLLGFSFGENAQFEAPLLAALKPRAAVYVINVDRFFDGERTTSPTDAIRHRAGEARSGYEEKRLWQPVHKAICSSLPALCGHQVAFFRTRSTGAWRLEGSEDFKAKPVADAAPEAGDVDRWKRYAALGEEFIDHLPVDRSCVVLTVAPWEATKASEAKAIAEALKLDLVAPQLPALRTLDGDHLDRASAQRWSSAFFEAAGPRIRECLARAPRH